MAKRLDATVPKFDERNPFALLGPHAEHDRYVVRTVQPGAARVDVRTADGQLVPMPHLHDGVYDARIAATPRSSSPPDYRLVITDPGDHFVDVDDPYRYGRVLTDFDLHLLGEGTHHHVYKKLGT